MSVLVTVPSRKIGAGQEGWPEAQVHDARPAAPCLPAPRSTWQAGRFCARGASAFGGEQDRIDATGRKERVRESDIGRRKPKRAGSGLSAHDGPAELKRPSQELTGFVNLPSLNELSDARAGNRLTIA